MIKREGEKKREGGMEVRREGEKRKRWDDSKTEGERNREAERE